MKTPTPNILANRLIFAAELLNTVGLAAAANLRHLPDTPLKLTLLETAPILEEISSLYRRQAHELSKPPQNRQQEAGRGSKSDPRVNPHRA